MILAMPRPLAPPVFDAAAAYPQVAAARDALAAGDWPAMRTLVDAPRRHRLETSDRNSGEEGNSIVLGGVCINKNDNVPANMLRSLPQGCALAFFVIKNHPGTFRPGHFRGAVRGVPVNNKQFISIRPAPLYHLFKGVFLIKGRNDDGNLHQTLLSAQTTI